MNTLGDIMSTLRDIMSTSGDIMSTSRGYNEYIGGYHEYIRERIGNGASGANYHFSTTFVAHQCSR